jgi:hypothetical protein
MLFQHRQVHIKVFLMQYIHVFGILAARSSNHEPITYDIFVVAGGIGRTGTMGYPSFDFRQAHEPHVGIFELDPVLPPRFLHALYIRIRPSVVIQEIHPEIVRLLHS